jgi:catechol 2,3-dioxygenase-like lactoylglutathione lyase family enzyme
MNMSITHIAVVTEDMQESIRFYTKALGFTEAFELNTPETGEPWIVFLKIAPGQFMELFYNGTRPNPWMENRIGMDHLCFAVDDLEGSTHRIINAGYRMESMPNKGCDGNWQAWVIDPNGVRVELMQIEQDSQLAQYF